MHKELIRQLLLHLSLLNADFTIQGLLFSDFQIKAFKEKYLITNRVKNEDCKISEYIGTTATSFAYILAYYAFYLHRM